MRPAERMRYLVLAAQREGSRWLAKQLRPLGLTPSQAEVLRVLADHGPLSLTGLGELLVCESGTNPSRLVDRLVEAGFVGRSAPNADDRRQVSLELTTAGRTREVAVRQVEERMYSDLDNVATERELTVLLDVLGRLVAGRPAGIALTNRIADQDQLASDAVVRALGLPDAQLRCECRSDTPPSIDGGR